VIFTGACEVLGAALLLFRRTSMLGALVSAAVMSNVVALNLCYDVPVKLYSTHILLMCIVLLAPDLPRLLHLFVLNRPAAAANLGELRYPRRSMRVAAVTLKVLVLGYFLFDQVSGRWETLKTRQIPPKPPIYGLYNVVKVDPPQTPAWRKLIIEDPSSFTVRKDDDSIAGFRASYDEAKSLMIVNEAYHWTWSRPAPDHLVLDGSLFGEPISITLRKVDAGKMRLNGTGFHWISEFPVIR